MSGVGSAQISCGYLEDNLQRHSCPVANGLYHLVEHISDSSGGEEEEEEGPEPAALPNQGRNASEDSSTDDEWEEEMGSSCLHVSRRVGAYRAFLQSMLRRMEADPDKMLEDYQHWAKVYLRSVGQWHGQDEPLGPVNLFGWRPDIQGPSVAAPTIAEVGGIEQWVRGLTHDTKQVFGCRHIEPVLPRAIYVTSKYDSRGMLSYGQQRGMWCEQCRTVYFARKSMYSLLFAASAGPLDELDHQAGEAGQLDGAAGLDRLGTLKDLDRSAESGSSDDSDDSQDSDSSDESGECTAPDAPVHKEGSGAVLDTYSQLVFPHFQTRVLLPFGDCSYKRQDSYESNSVLKERLQQGKHETGEHGHCAHHTYHGGANYCDTVQAPIPPGFKSGLLTSWKHGDLSTKNNFKGCGAYAKQYGQEGKVPVTRAEDVQAMRYGTHWSTEEVDLGPHVGNPSEVANDPRGQKNKYIDESKKSNEMGFGPQHISRHGTYSGGVPCYGPDGKPLLPPSLQTLKRVTVESVDNPAGPIKVWVGRFIGPLGNYVEPAFTELVAHYRQGFLPRYKGWVLEALDYMARHPEDHTYTVAMHLAKTVPVAQYARLVRNAPLAPCDRTRGLELLKTMTVDGILEAPWHEDLLNFETRLSATNTTHNMGTTNSGYGMREPPFLVLFKLVLWTEAMHETEQVALAKGIPLSRFGITLATDMVGRYEQALKDAAAHLDHKDAETWWTAAHAADWPSHFAEARTAQHLTCEQHGFWAMVPADELAAPRFEALMQLWRVAARHMEFMEDIAFSKSRKCLLSEWPNDPNKPAKRWRAYAERHLAKELEPLFTHHTPSHKRPMQEVASEQRKVPRAESPRVTPCHTEQKEDQPCALPSSPPPLDPTQPTRPANTTNPAAKGDGKEVVKPFELTSAAELIQKYRQCSKTEYICRSRHVNQPLDKTDIHPDARSIHCFAMLFASMDVAVLDKTNIQNLQSMIDLHMS